MRVEFEKEINENIADFYYSNFDSNIDNKLSLEEMSCLLKGIFERIN